MRSGSIFLSAFHGSWRSVVSSLLLALSAKSSGIRRRDQQAQASLLGGRAVIVTCQVSKVNRTGEEALHQPVAWQRRSRRAAADANRSIFQPAPSDALGRGSNPPF